jgi:tellurite resistance protein
VLAADGFMTDNERAVLDEAMATNALDPAERRLVSDLDRMTEAEEVVRALPEDARRALVDDLIAAALADGKLSPHETKTVAAISTAIGL